MLGLQEDLGVAETINHLVMETPLLTHQPILEQNVPIQSCPFDNIFYGYRLSTIRVLSFNVRIDRCPRFLFNRIANIITDVMGCVPTEKCGYRPIMNFFPFKYAAHLHSLRKTEC